MSWRAESTFKPSSAYTDEEKEFLKLSKKLREVLKLEEKSNKGETLEQLQQEKVTGKDKMVKEVIALAAKLPANTEVLGKNQDIADLLPNSALQDAEKKRKQEQARLERKEAAEAQKRKEPEFMCRHDRPILAITVSKDSKNLFTCSKDKYVLCWSLKDALMTCICTFAGHNGAVWALDVSAAPAMLLSGSADSKVMLWQGDPTKLRVGTVTSPQSTWDHGGIVRVLRWCPFDSGETRRFASASEKLGSKPPAIAVWKVSQRGQVERLLQLENLPTKANDLQWGSGAKTKLFSAHDNGYVGVWSAEGEGSLLKTIKLHAGAVSSLCLANNGSMLVTSSHDRTVAVVDVSKPSTDTVATYKANRPLNAVVVSADFEANSKGAVVVGGGKDPRDVTTSKEMAEDEFEAQVLDAVSGEPVAAGKGHFGPVHALLALPTLGPHGAFASASEDGCVKVHGIDGKLLHSDTLQG